MGISQLDIVDFRNLRHVELIPDALFNIIVGHNGSGKTNLLEAIYLLNRGRSFRLAKHRNMVRIGASCATVFAQINSPSVHRIGVEIEGNRFKGKLDGQALRRSSDLAKTFPLTLITPDCSKLIQSSPGIRRKFLDLGLFHVKQDYFATWRRFMKALNQRNHALRIGDKRQAGIWSAQLAQYGTWLHNARSDYICEFSESAVSILKELFSFNELCIQYQQGWEQRISYQDALDHSIEADLKRGFTQRGPHRANLNILIDGQRAEHYLSGGEQKIVACALILAQSALYKRITKRQYTVLVDDFAAELDGTRRANLLKVLLSLGNQVFLTATTKEVIKLKDNEQHSMFHVKQGLVVQDNVS